MQQTRPMSSEEKFPDFRFIQKIGNQEIQNSTIRSCFCFPNFHKWGGGNLEKRKVGNSEFPTFLIFLCVCVCVCVCACVCVCNPENASSSPTFLASQSVGYRGEPMSSDKQLIKINKNLLPQKHFWLLAKSMVVR